MKKLATCLIFLVPAVAFSATYSEANKANGSPGVALTSLGTTGCVYASAPVALGDIISHADGSQEVCASGKNGSVFMDLAVTNGVGVSSAIRQNSGVYVQNRVDSDEADVAQVGTACKLNNTITTDAAGGFRYCQGHKWVRKPSN